MEIYIRIALIVVIVVLIPYAMLGIVKLIDRFKENKNE